MAKKKKAPKRPVARPAPRRLRDRLDAADELMRRKRWPEARNLLADLAREYPQEAEV